MLQRLLASALALALGCGDPAPMTPSLPAMTPSPCPGEAGLAAPPPMALALGAFALDADGRSEPARVEVPAGTGRLVLHLLPGEGMDPAACLQIHALEDGAGRPWVTPPASRDDLGPYCRSCPQRVTVGVGGGTYVLPSGPDVSDEPVRGPLTLRGALRDCETLLSGRPAPGQAQRLRLFALGLPPVTDGARLTLPVEVLITPSSFFADPAQDAALTETFALLNQELAQAGVSITVVRRQRLPAAPDPLEFTAGEHGALRALRAQAACGASVVPIIFGGCLRLRDPILGRTDEPEGYATHIPGGPADGIYIKGRSCAGATLPWPAPFLSRILQHELGHFLGLYHVVEQDGTLDALADTGPDNIMNVRPLTEGARGLSPAQIRVLRRHPFLRPLLGITVAPPQRLHAPLDQAGGGHGRALHDLRDLLQGVTLQVPQPHRLPLVLRELPEHVQQAQHLLVAQEALAGRGLVQREPLPQRPAAAVRVVQRQLPPHRAALHDEVRAHGAGHVPVQDALQPGQKLAPPPALKMTDVPVGLQQGLLYNV